MLIGRDYMLKKPHRSSMPKFVLDTQVVPLAVNVAGGLEVALDRASTRSGVRPSVILAGMIGLVSVVVLGLLRSRSAERTS